MSDQLPFRRVLLGVSGSIAAINTPHVALALRRQWSLEVKAVLTRQASTLVSPRAVAVATANQVFVDEPPDVPIAAHVELTDWADVVLVWPASADVLGKAANGIADDLLTTCLLIAACPVVFVPHMNPAMWAKTAVRRNARRLEQDGCAVVAPNTGIAMANGLAGLGASPPPASVIAAAAAFIRSAPAEETA